MPANTPLGITYPLQTDTIDPAVQIAEIATDTDTIVQTLVNRIAAVATRPVGRVGAIANQVIVANTTTAVTLTGGEFSTPMEDPANNRLNLTVSGVYIVTAGVLCIGNAAALPYAMQLQINSDAGFITVPAAVSLPLHNTRGTWVNVSAVHYATGALTDHLTLSVRHNSGASVTIQNRHLTACKVSNDTGLF